MEFDIAWKGVVEIISLASFPIIKIVKIRRVGAYIKGGLFTGSINILKVTFFQSSADVTCKVKLGGTSSVKTKARLMGIN